MHDGINDPSAHWPRPASPTVYRGGGGPRLLSDIRHVGWKRQCFLRTELELSCADSYKFTILNTNFFLFEGNKPSLLIPILVILNNAKKKYNFIFLYV